MIARLKNSTALKNLAQKNVLLRTVHRFRQEEDGVLAFPFIICLLIMLLFGGVGIDMMRMERDRTKLQYTLDRAVLAAADLDQQLEPEAVVLDYLTKAGLETYYSKPYVERGLGYRIVDANIDTTFDTHFMQFSGGDTDLPLYARSRAEESVGSVEISLVLDISGSMGSNQRLPRLKVAAKQFIDQISASTTANGMSMSIVPYATQVNVGESLLDQYVTTQEHRYSHCVNFIADEFKKTNLSREVELERTGHFDPFTWAENGIFRPVCPVRAGSAITAFSGDADALKAQVDLLTASGNTSIDIGMKWGATLLDPSTQSVVSDLIDEGVIDASMLGRPYSYDDDTLKIIILMSDGENTTQYMLNPSRRDGPSGVWYNQAARNEAVSNYQSVQKGYSIEHSQGGSNKPFWWPYYKKYMDHPYGNGTYYQCDYFGNCGEKTEPGNPDGAVELSYPELYNRASIAWIAKYIHSYSPSAWSDWYTAGTNTLNRVAKDQHAKNMCDRTKDKGVVIYTIGFEAPKNGTRLLEACASSPAHFFDVDGLEISDAFASIATSIRQLRLTQ